MIPYDIDPSLHDREPQAVTLEDGFSAPPHHADGEAPRPTEEAALEAALAAKSDF